MRLDDLLACPVDRTPLVRRGEDLTCADGHAYPCPDGVPVLFDESLAATHPAFAKSLADARAGEQEPQAAPGEIDPVVQEAVAATCGYLYRHLVGRLTRYPIPELRLPPGEGRLFLEIGASWGRWCVAAARRGYVAVGIDPSLEAIRAARRVAQALGVEAHFVVGDARALPFREDAFDVGFSYSVFQHFSKENTRAALRELHRVVRPGGTTLVQMANALGVRCALRRALDALRPQGDPEFRVRYWTPRELARAFEQELGASRLEPDGFFSLNAQAADLDLFPPHLRAVVRASDALRATATVAPPLTAVADSVYVRSTVA